MAGDFGIKHKHVPSIRVSQPVRHTCLLALITVYISRNGCLQGNNGSLGTETAAVPSEGPSTFGQAAWQFLTDDSDEVRDSTDGGQPSGPITVDFSAHLRGAFNAVAICFIAVPSLTVTCFVLISTLGFARAVQREHSPRNMLFTNQLVRQSVSHRKKCIARHAGGKLLMIPPAEPTYAADSMLPGKPQNGSPCPAMACHLHLF